MRLSGAREKVVGDVVLVGEVWSRLLGWST
jgi:hypothetical protein